MNEKPRNLILPGTPRNQPKALVPHFGYDNLYRGVARVEIATLQTLSEIGIVPAADMALLTPVLIDKVISIPTTEVDEVERNVTRHDIRAWVRLAQTIVPIQIGRWFHVPLTSYDPLDSGRILHYVEAYYQAIRPAIISVINLFIDQVRSHAHTLQIGRTHGQHALPITVGFWLATILDRLVRNARQLDVSATQLVGKISGAVGAYNAQVGLGFGKQSAEPIVEMTNTEVITVLNATFEDRVLAKLGLRAAPISTQILPPEPLARFLFDCVLLSGALGQFGRDGRNLMRTEIGEVAEATEPGQVSSSTMAHKKNPRWFEQLEGMYWRNQAEFLKVTQVLISEHQRDLVGSSIMRDFPIILVNLQCQLDALLRKNKEGTPFLARMAVNQEACRKNFEMSAKVILAEPLYIALLMAGFTGDAHALVNDTLVPRARAKEILLIEALNELGDEDDSIAKFLEILPSELTALMYKPAEYTGAATQKALEIAENAEQFVATT